MPKKKLKYNHVGGVNFVLNTNTEDVDLLTDEDKEKIKSQLINIINSTDFFKENIDWSDSEENEDD